MNKANVFLLVVVSSLLTYISTATQPAATAGVAQAAQEKWEYGVSFVDDNEESITYQFKSASSVIYRIEVSLSRFGGAYHKIIDTDKALGSTETDFFKPGSAPTKEAWVRDKEPLFQFDAAEAHASLGDDGWHPYQQILFETDENPVEIWRYQTFWRRRVQ